jgi:phasin family protein
MFEQVANQVLSFHKNAAQALIKANGIAVEGFEKLVEVQLSALKSRVDASQAFVAELSEARDLETLKVVFPKSIALTKESFEHLSHVGQEALGIVTKTNESLIALVKGNLEAANEQVVKTVKNVKRA